MSLWQTVTWDVARAGGLTAYALLTIAVVLGLALSSHLQSPSKWPRLLNNELHNFLTLLALVFTGIHILAVAIDPFTHFGLNEILIPFVSYYRPLWMSLGIVAFYLGLAIGLSTWIRPLIGYAWWRRLHVFTLLIFALVTLHGIATGTDTQTWWAAAIYVISVIAVGSLTIRRFLVPATAQGRRHPVLAIATLFVLLAGCFWALIGPFQANWAVAAGSQKNVTTNAQSSDPFAAPFSALLQGQLTQNNATTNGMQTIRMDMTLSNGAQGSMTIVIQGQTDGSGNGSLNVSSTKVSLGQTTSSPTYQGTLVSLRNTRRIEMVAQLNNSASKQNIEVQINLQTDNSGQISGTIQGVPTTGSPSSGGNSGGSTANPTATPSTSSAGSL